MKKDNQMVDVRLNARIKRRGWKNVVKGAISDIINIKYLFKNNKKGNK